MPRMIYYYTKNKVESAIGNPEKLKRELKKARKTLSVYEIEALDNWLDKKVGIKIENYFSSYELRVS